MRKSYEVIAKRKGRYRIFPYIAVQVRAHKRVLKINYVNHYISLPNIIFIVKYRTIGFFRKKFEFVALAALKAEAPFKDLSKFSNITRLNLPNTSSSGMVCLGSCEIKIQKDLDLLIQDVLNQYFTSNFTGYSYSEEFPDCDPSLRFTLAINPPSVYLPKDILEFAFK
jgi:hypothetical protein